MKKSLIILLFFIQTTLSYSNNNIVYLDVQYIIDNSELGLLYKNKISDNQKNIKEDLSLDEKVIKEKELFIKDKKNILKKEELEEYIKEFNILFEKYKIKRNDIRKKFLEEKNDYTAKILNILNPILKDYVQKNDIVLVLEKKNILVGAKVLDITQNILKILNEETKIKKLTNED